MRITKSDGPHKDASLECEPVGDRAERSDFIKNVEGTPQSRSDARRTGRTWSDDRTQRSSGSLSARRHRETPSRPLGNGAREESREIRAPLFRSVHTRVLIGGFAKSSQCHPTRRANVVGPSPNSPRAFRQRVCGARERRRDSRTTTKDYQDRPRCRLVRAGAKASRCSCRR